MPLPSGSVIGPSAGRVEGSVAGSVTVESDGVAEESVGTVAESVGTGVGVVEESAGVIAGSSGAAVLLESSPQAHKKRSAAAESVKLDLVLIFIVTSFMIETLGYPNSLLSLNLFSKKESGSEKMACF